MSAGIVQLYADFKVWQFSPGASLTSGSVRLALLSASYTPTSADAEWADISANEIAHASYIAGGFFLSTPSVTQTAGVGKFASDGIANSFLGSGVSPKWAVFYLDATLGTRSQPLIAYFDLNAGGGALSVAAGTELVINCPTGGWFDWS